MNGERPRGELRPGPEPRLRRNLLDPSAALLRTICALLAALALGCAAGVERVEHAVDAKQFAGEPLSPQKGRGAQRFRAELQYDKTLADYVAEHGRPDYFYIVDREKLYLFYTKTDRAAMFERILVEASQVTELGRIPGSLLKLLPRQTREQIEARRAAEQRRAQTNARRSRAQIARSAPRTASPAAVAPEGAYIGGFDVSEIVARMRDPLTAADPGVPDWRESRVQGGKRTYTAQVGRTRYEVGAERVAFTVFLSASRANLPASARLAIQRLNSAIFAAKADAVTQQMIELAERSVADRSGRTSFAERIAGRTIRIGRRVDAGVFAYSVSP